MYGLAQRAKGLLRCGAAVLLALLLCGGVPVRAAESGRLLVPVGHTVGIKLFSRGIVVVKLSDGPARESGLQTGDVIVTARAPRICR